MVADIVERLGELAPPGGVALPGPAVDEVEAVAREQRRGEPHGGQRLDDRVLSAESLEVKVVQRLHADREPVDAGRPVAAKPLGFDAGRVGFERDLRVFVEPPGGGDRIDDPLHGLRAHERGRAAAEKHRAHRPARRKRRAMGDFGLERREIARFVDFRRRERGC